MAWTYCIYCGFSIDRPTLTDLRSKQANAETVICPQCGEETETHVTLADVIGDELDKINERLDNIEKHLQGVKRWGL